MKNHRSIKNELKMALMKHPTWMSSLEVPDCYLAGYFNITSKYIFQNVKSNMYLILREGIGRLADALIENNDNYNLAFKEIKKQGFCLPFRIRSHGWEEPKNRDELADWLSKFEFHWDTVYSNAKKRKQSIEQKKSVEKSYEIYEEPMEQPSGDL